MNTVYLQCFSTYSRNCVELFSLCLHICFEWLRKAKKKFSQDSQSPGWDINLGSIKYETGTLPTQPQNLMSDSSEVNSHAVSKVIHNLSQKRNVHYHIHKSPHLKNHTVVNQQCRVHLCLYIQLNSSNVNNQT
jgi:hypothetical protein